MKPNASRLIDALKKLILVSAITHLAILGYQVLASGDISLINYFNIIDIDLLFPSFPDHVGAIGSFAFAIGLYLVIYLFFTHENRPHSR